MENIIVFGGGGHARSCIDLVLRLNKYKVKKIIGLEGDNNSDIFNIKVDNSNFDIKELEKKYKNALIAIGQIKTPEPRKKIYNILKKNNFSLPSIISDLAYISDKSQIQESCTIMNMVNINSGVSISSNCIINSGAIIEHDVKIEKHCHISTGAILNGGVTIGEGSFIGSGAILHEQVKVIKNSIIPAGSIIKK
jgi:sugar O-acyltransferase (sialic acid O-acetyltransferase NeuD family)